MRHMFCLTSLVLFSASSATNWGPPTPRIFSSSYSASKYGFKLLPQLGKEARSPATGELFQLNDNGELKSVWRTKLLNNPMHVYLSPEGQVMTLDSYAAFSAEHALVIYNKQGKVLSDYTFSQVAPGREFEANISMGAPLLSGIFKPEVTYLGSGGAFFVLRGKGKNTLVFNLTTGKRVR